jgi:hypothetical protein
VTASGGDLQSLLAQDLREISSEYERIAARAREDPGTAGDQGELNWAKLLRSWLPPSYQVETKGRILGSEGQASPQVDVVVLRPEYPKRLLDMKVYLASGVAAAFECKITLESSSLTDAPSTAAKLAELAPRTTGTPYRELCSPILFGVLAHSHPWKAPGSTPRENVDRHLQNGQESAPHPSGLIDLVCVADVATWTMSKHLLPTTGRMPEPHWSSFLEAMELLPEGGITTQFVRSDDLGSETPNPVGVLVAAVNRRLAWEDPNLRPLADFYRQSRLQGGGTGLWRRWDWSVVSPEITTAVAAGRLVNTVGWDEWAMVFW